MTSTDITRAVANGDTLPTAGYARANHVTQTTAVEQARAVAEVAAAVAVARDNPRDIAAALAEMRMSCSQIALAERAFYSLPRAGGRIEGSTVHLARELGRCWRNIDHGVRELSRDDTGGTSEIQAWAWDQENNVRASRSFVVPHARMVKKSREALTDLGDITNNNNSVGARAAREVMWQVLPVWLKAEAEALCAKTLHDGGGKTLPQQVADAIGHYRDTWNVTVDQLHDRLKRPSSKWTVQDVAGLRVLSGELTRGEKRADDEFAADRVTLDEVAQRASKPAPKQEPGPVEPTAEDLADLEAGR